MKCLLNKRGNEAWQGGRLGGGAVPHGSVPIRGCAEGNGVHVSLPAPQNNEKKKNTPSED